MIKTIWNWVKGIFGSKPDGAHIEDNPLPRIEIPDHEKYFQSIGNIVTISPADDTALTQQSFLNGMSVIGEELRKLGVSDGLIGQRPDSIVDIVKSRVKTMQIYISTIFQVEFNKIKIEEEAKRKIYYDSKNDYETYNKYVETINNNYYWDYKNFNLAMGIFYLLVAALLIIADIPLSYLITKQVFSIEDDFLTLILSIGIALCAIYIKIFYDEYLSFPIDKTVYKINPNLMKDKASKIDGTNDNESGVKFIKGVNRIWSIRLYFKSFLLLFSIATITILGYVRYNFFIAKEFGMNSNSSSMSFESEFNVVENESSNDVLRKTYDHWTTPSSFILITLLFPLIGGICASLAADKIQNHWESNNSRKLIEIKRGLFLSSMNDLSDAGKKLENCNSYLKWANGDPFYTDYVKYFLACYVHGYERGILESNNGKDLFAMANNFRQNYLGYDSFEKLSKIRLGSLFDDLKNKIYNEKDNKST